MALIVEKSELFVLNHCAKHIGRAQGEISESWRFPIVASYGGGEDPVEAYGRNEVTFVYAAEPGNLPAEVGIIGTFENFHLPILLHQAGKTRFFSVTLAIPKGEVHLYKFIVDGRMGLDPINPQQVVLDNGRRWSRFFTQLCTQPLSFERWESDLLERLTRHILPFETKEGRNFLQRYYNQLDKREKEIQYAHAYRLDQSVGVVNFIDKLMAREERHNLDAYHACLGQVDAVLRRRYPDREPRDAPKEAFKDVYVELAAGRVDGWDLRAFDSPRRFLEMLRRHTWTGAFSHPKHGGNVGGSGWAFLEERFTGEAGTFYDWRRATEFPLGTDTLYRG